MASPSRGAAGPLEEEYPPIGDYGFISDGHSVALIDRWGSIDWCCFGRVDRESCFGRLLDRKRGGYFRFAPSKGGFETFSRYLPGTLVLETRFRGPSGEVRLLDAFALCEGGREHCDCRLLRVLEGVRGSVQMLARCSPRFDYGNLRPWVRSHGPGLWSAIGGDLGLALGCDLPLRRRGLHDLWGRVTLREGERRRLWIRSQPPHRLYPGGPERVEVGDVDRALDETVDWWLRWSGRARADFEGGEGAVRSALVLKGLMFAPTGAIAAAATTSLPEHLGGERNWDYRYSWVRDSSFALQSLVTLGYREEAVRFRHFLERATAGSVEELKVAYRVTGDRHLPEREVFELEGYRGSRPVRIGNGAHQQLQLDIYGDLLDTAWRSAEHGDALSREYWELLVQVADAACELWEEADQGIWETRGPPQHFVHSKVMCWVACDRALRLAERFGLEAAVGRWRKNRDEIRTKVEKCGYDRERGIFVRSFGSRQVDASLLLLPRVGFVDYEDARMVRTVDAVRHELAEGGLVRRYRSEDGLSGREGVFVACTFWLVECLARQRRRAEAEAAFERAVGQANELGLFAEEYDPEEKLMLGNYPQALSHYSHILALITLAENGGVRV